MKTIAIIPVLYLGIPRRYFVIHLLASNITCNTNAIMLTLKNNRVNLTFALLTIDFGMSESNASKIFKKRLY